MDGLIWCYKKNFNLIVTMDGDGTHDPKYINKLIKKTKNNYITISNRFLKKFITNLAFTKNINNKLKTLFNLFFSWNKI